MFTLTLGICLVALCFPAVASTSTPTLADLRAQLTQPEVQVDFAKAKLTIDRLIDPSIDAASVMRELDALTAAVKSRIPAGASRRSQLDILLATLYQPGAWNGNRPFTYDLADPFGKNHTSKLLSAYLTTRKGNCVSMPILVAIIGQRLGLGLTLATAPEHVLVKAVDDEGRWLNL